MTATARLVKMAACPPIDGDGVDSENFVSTSSLQASKLFPNNSQIKTNSSRGNSKVISLDGEKAYDTVAKFEENELRNLLEEVINPKQNKNDKSAIAQFLIRKEEDALREESGSGEDTIELALGRQKKKKSNYRREHCVVSQLGSSAATRNNTGGSLGSLHNLSDPKVPEQTNTNTQGVASRSRAGGSCGNLSKGSFETHVCKRKSRRSRDLNRASTSQREGGSLQNLSKTEAASNEAKKLHKSGSLSQVFSDVGGVRIKNRRQKTSSESSTRAFCRRSEDREAAGESSEEEIGEYPYQRLLPSHSSGSGHSCNPGDPSAVGMVGGLWNGDHMSDVPSGETTEEDGEFMHIAARAKLGDSSGSRHQHCDGSDTELHSVISHTAHRDLPTISSDSEVDKTINFCLSKNQDDAMTSSIPSTVLSYAAPNIKTVFDGKSTAKEDDNIEKKKLRSTKSENGSYESSLDENGNPVLMGVRSSVSASSSSSIGTGGTGASIFSSQVACNDRHSSSLSIGRRNGFTTQAKDASTYNRMKAKQDKKKAIKEKDIMPSEKTPGFRGDDSIDAILKFLGAEDSSNSKSKKRSKGKKDDEKDGVKNKKAKSFDKSSNEDIVFDKIKFDDVTNENFSGKGRTDESSGSDTKERREEDGKKSKKSQDKKRGKKGSGLRESSSVEDLVSKSKQIDDKKEVRKQITVDDGGLSPFHCHGNPKSEYNFESNVKSEFSYDFYKVGDAILEPEPMSSETGDFEVVNRKRGKKARNSSVSQSTKMNGGSGGWTNSSHIATSDDHKRSTFPRSNPRNSGKASSQDKPQINFSEGPFTVHDGVFLSQFSGNRSSNGERYTTTTSVPHSEDSDSDGGDSVHSMPAHVITPRPHVRKPPPSTDSTPQASYANIAKLAASANKAQMKRVAMANHVGTAHNASEDDNEQNSVEDTILQEPKMELSNSILDDNFPPLSGGISSSATGAITNNNNNLISETNSVNSDANQGVPSSQDSTTIVKKDLKMTYSGPNSDLSLCENNVKTTNCSYAANNSSDNSSILSDNSVSTSKVQQPVSTSPCISCSPYSQNLPLLLPSNISTAHHLNSTVVSKPVVPHTQTIIYNNTSAQKIPNHVPSLKFINQNIKSSSGNKYAASVNAVIQPQLPSSQNSSMNSLQKESNDRNKNSVPKENKSSNSRHTNSSRHSKTKDSLENGGSRSKRYEAAVIFTDHAKFDLSNFEIEFGFDMTFDNITNADSVDTSDSNNGIEDNTLDNNNKSTNLKVLQSTIDYSKLYQAPVNDVISYNYEELCRHVYKGWESTLRMLEEDPTNIQFWKATENANKD